MDYQTIELVETGAKQQQRDYGAVAGGEDAKPYRVSTDRGEVLVAVQGDTRKQAIVTYHDIGLNYSTNFKTFFNYPEMRQLLLQHFCVYHVNAPGQQFGAENLPEDYTYPTMDELSLQLDFVITRFNIRSFIGFGCGAGANILVRFALRKPELVRCLCLINCVSTQAGWLEWFYQKYNVWYLRQSGFVASVTEYLMWHHFGKDIVDRNIDLFNTYKHYYETGVNPYNLSLFIESYVTRTDLNLIRQLDVTNRNPSETLEVRVLNLTGFFSPHANDTVTFNGRLSPEKCSWMKVSNCGMPLEEDPKTVTEAFKLLVQGYGFAI